MNQNFEFYQPPRSTFDKLRDLWPQINPRSSMSNIHVILLIATFFTMSFHLGIAYALTLMLILFCHEMGHFVASRLYQVDATFPYFLPSPFPFGTFGAFIKIKSPIPTKKALFDIGAAGPLAGFVPSLFAIIIGLALSLQLPMSQAKQLSYAPILGDSILTYSLGWLMFGNPNESMIFIHPIGLAGWLGLFITALNLLPVGQLDGGHICYAMFGRKSVAISRTVIFALFIYGVFTSNFLWVFWAMLLLFVLGPFHPPTFYEYEELDPLRRALGIACIVIFLLTIIPTPFTIPDQPTPGQQQTQGEYLDV